MVRLGRLNKRTDGYKWAVTKKRKDWRTYKGVWYRTTCHKSLWKAVRDMFKPL